MAIGWYCILSVLVGPICGQPIYNQFAYQYPNQYQVQYPNQYQVQYPYQYQSNYPLQYQNLYQPGSQSFRNINYFLIRQYHSAQDFYAYNRQDLDKKVQDAVELMNEVRQNANDLMTYARSTGDTVLQNALSRVDIDYQQISSFQRQLLVDRTTPFQALEADWQNRINTVFNDGFYEVLNQANLILSDGYKIRASGIVWTISLAIAVLVILI